MTYVTPPMPPSSGRPPTGLLQRAPTTPSAEGERKGAAEGPAAAVERRVRACSRRSAGYARAVYARAVHARAVHAPTTRSPVTPSPATHSPTLRSPATHSPAMRSPAAYAPTGRPPWPP
ncbi:hypothetical protein GCM10010389_51490 [Streptomyces echinoruber]|uniref:Uncharacterized protein n=1 Tax=Streptomyces echinoruber TaxID=68898 RepID=A0A918VLA0_9ACTN|nr:hypothetical protein GCM10010389_51490 [Streptomyces echinoruber]